MEVELNLLPEYRKEEIEKSRRFWLVLRIEIAVIAIAAIFTLLLWSYNIILGLNYESIAVDVGSGIGSNSADYEKMKVFDEEFKKINERVGDILTVKNDQIYWYNLFLGLQQVDAGRIAITDLATKNYSISLVGVAQKRDDLTAFKSSLEGSRCFSDINLPLSNLVKKENVDFQMDMKIKSGCLKEQK